MRIKNNIIPDDSKINNLAPRPYDTQLNDDKYDINKYKFIDFKESISLCFNKFYHTSLLNNHHDKFFVLDLDGTLIDSSQKSYLSYEILFKKYNKPFITSNEWDEHVNNTSFDTYLLEVFGDDRLSSIKFEKLKIYSQMDIELTKNCNNFLEYLIKYNINHCIVTNTNRATINIIKNKIPILQKINNWIVREDYKKPKPNSEGYQLAIKEYYNNEKYIIGIEDTLSGFEALKGVTDIIYIFNNDNVFKTEDCYIFNDYNQLMDLRC